jgi:translation initiation factor 2 subunit 1
MLLRRQEWPEEGELVLCKVTKIMPSSVFCNLEEYGRSGMIHISEISPGRIRNIRDFVIEGKVVICKILGINREKGYIDLSLRRVSESMRRNKNDEIKQELKAEKIVEMIAKELKTDVRKLYDEITKKIFENSPLLYPVFEDVALKGVRLVDLGVEEKIAAKFEELIRQKIKAPEIFIEGEFKITSYVPDGVETIKQALSPIEKKKDTIIKCLGNGRYMLKITAEDYKTAEKMLKDTVDSTIDFMHKKGGSAEFIRTE